MSLKHRSLIICSLFLTISSANIAEAGKKKDAGAIAGAIIGGIIGNELGRGDNQAIATGIGVIVGAVIGNEIGRDLDQADRRAMAEAQRRAFERPYGERVSWDGAYYGSRTQSHGEFRTIRQGRMRNSAVICREYENVIITPRKTTVKKGIACSQANGGWIESRYEDVDFSDYSSSPYYPERPSYEDSLAGYCQDYNHENFYAAKEFAQDYSSGLGLYTSQATEWAMDYNRTHRCNTIQEYKRRFKAILTFATDYSNGLGQYTSQARTMASQWVNNNCEGVQTIERIKQVYARELQFATSFRGLGMYTSEGRKYALRQIRPLTRCADILRAN